MYEDYCLEYLYKVAAYESGSGYTEPEDYDSIREQLYDCDDE